MHVPPLVPNQSPNLTRLRLPTLQTFAAAAAAVAAVAAVAAAMCIYI